MAIYIIIVTFSRLSFYYYNHYHYHIFVIEDIYKSKLLILYYKILKLSSPRYFDTFIPKNFLYLL